MSVLDILACFVTVVALKGPSLAHQGNRSAVRLLTSLYHKRKEASQAFGIAVSITVSIRGWDFESSV